MAPANTPDLDQLAQRRARAKMGWLIHATVYVCVNAYLIALSLTTGRHWALFPLLGWGLGLLLHGISVWWLAPDSPIMSHLVERERARLGAPR